LGGNDEVDLATFTQDLWKTVKDKYKANLEVQYPLVTLHICTAYREGT
jgi:hypothetical protein